MGHGFRSSDRLRGTDCVFGAGYGYGVKVDYRYHSLEDFLTSVPLTVDAQFDDG